MFRALPLILLACSAFADVRPLPLEHQVKRIHDGIDLYGIVHWGLNTYTDREWGFGDENPALLAPTSFDAEQIVRSAKAGGLQGLIFVAKHHDGFCLWPTKTTEHNITKSPFRDGNGDYVREMSDACRRTGLKFGVYCSPWDRNNPDYGTERYAETFRAQIGELLDGRYGDVFEMWFDNANGGDGYYGGARETRKIPPDYYRFDEVFRFVREMQPSVCIFNEDDAADFRWPGNEKGVLDEECRATAAHFDISRYDDYMKWTAKGVMDGVRFHPPEADFPLRPGWFYHEGEKGRTKSAEYLMRRYLNIVGNGGSMNVGIAPDKRGVLCDEDVCALERFGELRRAFFSCPVTTGLCNVVIMREDVSRGERVDDWVLSANGKALVKGNSIGIKRIRVLPRLVEAQNLKLQVSGRTDVTPTVMPLLCYRADGELLDRIFSSCAESDETDTAKWMNVGRGANPETVVLSNRFGRVKVSPVGAQVISYRPMGRQEVLFMPDDCDFSRNREMHGGIPFCWPWFGRFGEPGSRMHGLARYCSWRVAGLTNGTDVSRLVLMLDSSVETREKWPHDFHLKYDVVLADRLTLTLTAKNTGSDPFETTLGFHPYFRVRNPSDITVRGLKEPLRVYPGIDGGHETESGGTYSFDAGDDRIEVSAKGEKKLVVWNPGPDWKDWTPDCNLTTNDWRHFLCVEPAVIGLENAKRIAPGESDTFQMAISVKSAFGKLVEYAGVIGERSGWRFVGGNEDGKVVYIPFEGYYESKGGRIESPKFALDKGSDENAWYSLSFSAKSAMDGYWWVDFYDKEGRPLPDVNSRLYANRDWQAYDVVVPTRPEAATAQIAFVSKKGVFAKDVKMRRITSEEAAQWCDKFYATLPQLDYAVPNDAWTNLPKSMNAMNSTNEFRIVFLGDSIMNDTWCGNFGALLKRDFPRTNFKLYLSVRGSTGCWYYHEKEHFEEYVAKYRPDLVVIGGISNWLGSEKSTVKEAEDWMVETIERCKATGAEVVVCTPPPSYEFRKDENTVSFDLSLCEEGGLRHLRWDFHRNAATRTGVQLWDLTTGPCAAIARSRKPLNWFKRDAAHNDDRGKQLIAQTLAAYFRVLCTGEFKNEGNHDE